MSVRETIEDAIVQTLQGLTEGQSALLATAKGQTVRDRKSLTAAISRELLPAAYVMATGRDSSEKTYRRPGLLSFSVVLATRSFRSDDDARTGAVDVTGVFDLAEQVASALQDQVVATDRQLLLVDEHSVGGDEGTIIWEQGYEVRRLAELGGPTFGGVALAGAGSEVHVELGVLRRATSSFSFPGVDGVFERDLGTRERTIIWHGQLRAADHPSLNTIESNIEDEIRNSQEQSMVDTWGRTHEMCVLQKFNRRGLRRVDELTGEALQDFELEFTQLGR